MFSGRENSRGATNVNMENLFVQIFERKRRIVEQVKQQVDLYDQYLASKCLLAGVSPPPWLWPPPLPSQTSELNKEEIISGLLFPQSRPSIIFPSSHPFSYQKPVSSLAGNVVRQDLTTMINHPLEEQLLEEEQQQDLSHNVVRRVSNHSHEQDANIASPTNVHGEEGLPESVSTGIRENQSCPSPKYSQNQRVENSIDATSLGRSQGKMVPKSVSTTGCERKPSSPGFCQEETEPNPSLDPGLSVVKIQRSKSRQKYMELRSSAKASKSSSTSRNELKPSPGGNISLEIASLRSDSVSEIKLFKHDENDDRSRDEVENSSSQDKGVDQCIKFSSTTESSTPPQKVESVQKYSSEDSIASVNEMDISQSIETIDEVSVKVDEQVDDPQSTSCNETAYLDGDSRSESSHKDSSEKEHQKSSNSLSSDFPSRNSNPSHKTDHEVEFLQVMPMTNEVSMVKDAGTSIFQSEQNRSKTKYSGSVESTSIDVEPIHSGSLLQGGQAKESLNPLSDIEGFVVENITSDNQSEEKGECVDTNRCPNAGRVSPTGISTDETAFASAIRDSLPKTELVGDNESSSVELQSRHSAMQSEDVSVLLKPVTGEDLLEEEDNNGESIEISSISKSRSLSQADITVVEPLVVESNLQESSTPEDLIDHSKRCDISSGSKEMQPQGSLTKAGSNQCHGRISRPRSSIIEEESENEYKAQSIGSDPKSAEKLLEVRAESSLLRTLDLPVFDNNEEHKINEIPMNSREKSTVEGALTPASTARMFDVPSLTVSEVNLSADNGMNRIEDSDGLMNEIVPEMESPASHSGMKAGENEPPESNTFAGHIDALAKRPQHETSSGNDFPSINTNIACTEIGESHGPETSIQKFLCPSSSMGGSQLQNKRRRILENQTSSVPSSTPEGDILDSGSVREKAHHLEEAACHNLDNYDVELQKMIGSASSDDYCVELQKMLGSSSSAELRFEEGYQFKEAGLLNPASLSCRPEQLSVQAQDLVVGSEDTNFFPCDGEASHPLASCVVRDSDGSSHLPPLGFIGSDEGSPPLLEGFIIQTEDESQSGSTDKKNHDSFQCPRTTVKSATVIRQISKSACMTTPSLHLAKKFNFEQSELFDGMFSSQNLEGNSVFDNLGIDQDYTGRSCTDSLPLSGAGSSANARNTPMSPTEKLWHRILENSSSSEKRVSQTPDLPCISEENEDEEAENLCTNTPKSIGSEKRGSSIPDLPCIAEEHENVDEIREVVNETSNSEKENVFVEMKPLGDANEDLMKILPSVSEAKIPVDRYSLDSVSTAFSFSATCNNSVKSKAVRKNAGSRRFTGKGKENQSGAGGGRNARPPSSRFSKAKLSCNSSLTTLGPRLAEKEPRHNNIVSNMTSFVPLVQQQKPPSALITGKRDVKVKALEAAEASKRMAEQKENDRKLKKEAMKLERARQEQENLRKQEMEKKKKEEDRKKKEAEMAYKLEMEKKRKEEERKRKEFEMADRKRQREQEDKKVKEAKRQRIAEIQKQQREAEQKLQTEKEMKRQAMDAKMKAQKELKGQSNPEKTIIGHANTKIPGALKSNSSDECNASRFSRDDDFKVLSNPGNMSEGVEKMEESYDISPYKCSDDEMEEEEEEDNNNKFVPTWASKSNVGLTVVSHLNLDPPKGRCPPLGQVLLPRRTQSRF